MIATLASGGDTVYSVLMLHRTFASLLGALALAACGSGERHVDPPDLPGPLPQLAAGEAGEATVSRGPSGEMTFDAHLGERPVTQFFQLDFTVHVLDATGRPAESVAVTVEGPQLTANEAGLQQLSDESGTVVFGVTLNAAGTQTLFIDTHSHGSMTVRVNVRPPVARFDGKYFCVFSYPVSGSAGAPLEFRPEIVFEGAAAAGFDESNLDQTSGAFAGVYRRSADASDAMLGTFVVDAQDRANASGTLEEFASGVATGAVGTWQCVRGEQTA